MPALLAAGILLWSGPTFADSRAPHRYELAAGILPLGCGPEGCGTGLAMDLGATGWVLERVGVSARIRGNQHLKWLEPSIRLRGFVGANQDREVDFGVGRGVFSASSPYRSLWKVETLVGFRAQQFIGVKVGAELFYIFKKRLEGSDSGIVASFALVFRPQNRR